MTTAIIPIRPLTYGEEIYAEVTAFLRSECRHVADDNLPDAVKVRWPDLPAKQFEALNAWNAIKDEITRRHQGAGFQTAGGG